MTLRKFFPGEISLFEDARSLCTRPHKQIVSNFKNMLRIPSSADAELAGLLSDPLMKLPERCTLARIAEWML